MCFVKAPIPGPISRIVLQFFNSKKLTICNAVSEFFKKF